MYIGFERDMCENRLSDMIKYRLTSNTNDFKQGGIMKGSHPNNRVNPTSLITVITEIFNPVLTRPQLKNLIVTVRAIALATSFRINTIAARLPIAVHPFKTKQQRLLRFLARRFPINAVMRGWLGCVVSRVCRSGTGRALILIDETRVFDECQAIGAAVPFRQRALPI